MGPRAVYTLFMLGPWLFMLIGMAWTTLDETGDPALLCELAGDPPHVPETVYWYFYLALGQYLWIWLLLAGSVSAIAWRVGWISPRVIFINAVLCVIIFFAIVISGKALSNGFYRAIDQHCFANEFTPDTTPPTQD